MSTDAVDFRGAVGTLFDTGWAGATPVAWPNRDFKPPSDQKTHWVRMSIFEADSRQHEIGCPTPQFREEGLVIFQVFAPRNKGDGQALTLADSIGNIFRKQKVIYTNGRAIFRAPQRRQVGPTSDGDWYQVNVSIPYVRDNIA